MISITWTRSTEIDDFGGEPTGDALDVYEAKIDGRLWVVVDEPHYGYGWRYAVSDLTDDYRRLADGDGYATADDAKAAASAALTRLARVG